MTPASERLASLRRRRAMREIELRYEDLVLRGLDRSTVHALQVWRSHAAALTQRPLSLDALGFGMLLRGGAADDLRDLEHRIDRAQELGIDRDRDVLPRLDAVVADVGRQVEEAVKYKFNAVDEGIAIVLLGQALRRDCANALREFAGGARTFVCSDVHLGIAGAHRDSFFDVVDVAERGDTLVLLGDILDFWIDDENEIRVRDMVVAQWRDLYDRLSAARSRGARVAYVPGNHDSFVFLLETAGHFDWSGTVLRRSDTLRFLRDALADRPLVSIADLSYPFLKRTYEGVEALLTHGHAHEWEWRFLSGSPELSGSSVAFVTAISTALAHRFARQLRHVFNLGDTAIEWVKRVQDVAIEITNLHLQAYGAARLRTLEGKTHFADELERVFRDLCESDTADNVAAILHRRALDRVQQYHEESDLPVVRAAVERYLGASPRAVNFALEAPDDSPVTLTQTPLRDLQPFAWFVCGHFHKPRDESPNHDSGCLYAYATTSLQINADGAILRPTI